MWTICNKHNNSEVNHKERPIIKKQVHRKGTIDFLLISASAFCCDLLTGTISDTPVLINKSPEGLTAILLMIAVSGSKCCWLKSEDD